MYEETEIDISRKYLAEVIASIDEPIVVLGGWAVRFLVNERYQENTGREYLGSRDIDLGFQISGTDMEDTAFAKALRKLEQDLGFKPVSFRLFKEIHSETGKELSTEEARNLPPYLIFPMYVDLIVDTITPEFKEHFRFTPIDEPLVVPIFADEENRVERKEFGKTIWLPTTELMLAMKMKSHPNRDKDNKKVKDMCDIGALLLFGSLPEGNEWLEKYLQQDQIETFKKALTPQDIEQAARIIGIDQATIEGVLAKYKLM